MRSGPLYNCVAVITGGSEGIGGAITRRLARSGVRIVIAERHGNKLERIRGELIAEMKSIGFEDAIERILILPNCDVTKAETLKTIVAQTINKFGRVDFVINNAGLVGAEEMTVDIPTSAWNQTVYGNLISNYQLILDALPVMTEQESGHILNMSSYFGGTRHGAVPYTNRADYAVSKGGQIALAQALAELLGPSIQINALAPGPVEGARLNGTEGRPGLYQRRAKLLNENKRLNQVYEAVVRALRDGGQIEAIITLLCMNRLADVLAHSAVPRQIEKLAKLYTAEADQKSPSSEYFLPKAQFQKLVTRLSVGGFGLAPSGLPRLLEQFVEPPQEFFHSERLENEAKVIKDRMIKNIALRRMPTDDALAQEVLSSLSHRTLTGEVIYPTCGFRFDGYNVGNCFRGDGMNLGDPFLVETDRLQARVDGQKVFILGDSMHEEILGLVSRYTKMGANVVVALFSKESKGLLRPESIAHTGVSFVDCENLDSAEAFSLCRTKHGRPDVVLSFPMRKIGSFTKSGSGDERLPTLAEFIQIVEANITNNFLVLKNACLVEDCRVVLVCPTRQARQSFQHGRWIEFVRSTLRPLTLAAGKEAGHLGHGTTIFQIGCDESNDEFYRMILVASLPKMVKQALEMSRAA